MRISFGNRAASFVHLSVVGLQGQRQLAMEARVVGVRKIVAGAD